jgi:two-component system alkaline phosphatase synthesis response regulator PhoP
MTKTILIVDDERDIVDLLKYNLQKEGYRTLTASNGKQALERADKKPDLILLDVMMPEYDGWEVLRRLRKKSGTAQIPVIFLTAKDSETDEVVGLELGADDYITKPISIPKLIARIKTTIRKKEQPAAPEAEPQVLRVGQIEIIPDQHIVRINKKEVFFPRKEFQTLVYLTTHLGSVVNRETLLNAVWGTDVYVVDRTVDVHIRKIREKLGKFAEYIETIKGVGYRMKEVE